MPVTYSSQRLRSVGEYSAVGPPKGRITPWRQMDLWRWVSVPGRYSHSASSCVSTNAPLPSDRLLLAVTKYVYMYDSNEGIEMI